MSGLRSVAGLVVATLLVASATGCGRHNQRAPVAPAIPCWRLAEVAPRVVEHAAYFEELPLTRQWGLAIGALERGQTGADVAIAYGKPYNSGSEAREDGSQATTLVFLDSAQEAYALHVTLVDDKVAGWKIPAERVLTPSVIGSGRSGLCVRPPSTTPAVAPGGADGAAA